ncbi:retropepsin-like aspartic protease family protein [Undibacterium danionis]|uniref:TIGR02281 family clan AA aspartic protease n=1 Tax=Undibacterium danionis TaxID=1812100 RepID=A0ABV6IAG8_9BURK
MTFSHLRRLLLASASTALLGNNRSAYAASDISLVALSNGKAMLVVDGKAPKMYAIGSNIDSTTKLIASTANSATIEVEGKKQILYLGHGGMRSTTESKNASVTLHANELGHFFTLGQINGGSSLRMIVDTGASFVAIPASEAIRLGIDYRKGLRARSNTANGIVPIYLIKLDSIKVGDIELFQVEASIHEGDLNICLLGMSFLKRVSMVREGQQMVLTKKI